jgi:hypothetical protein
VRSDIAYSPPHRIFVCGKELPDEEFGHTNFGDFVFLQFTGKRTTLEQPAAFNAILIMIVEHPKQLDVAHQSLQGATSSVSGRRHV